jgi:hypothetical protein
MSNPHILITSPSIHTKDNVSDIANLTRLLFENKQGSKLHIVYCRGKG